MDQERGYFKRLLIRSWAETKGVWTAHRWWLSLVATLMTIVHLAFTHGAGGVTIRDIATSGVAVALVAFFGSYAINFLQSFKRLDDDKAKEIKRLTPPSIEIARRQLVGERLNFYSEEGKKCLRTLLILGPTPVQTLQAQCQSGFQEVANNKAGHGDGLVIHTGDGRWTISQDLHSALSFHLLSDRPVTPLG